MGGKGVTAEVTEYFASLLLGVCWGPVTVLRGVWIGEKLALGTQVTTPMVLNVNRPDLFGDEEREGGAVGAVWFLPGDRYQYLPTLLAQKFHGGLPENVPGYRDICCIALTEFDAGDSRYPAAGGSVLNYAEGQERSLAHVGGFGPTEPRGTGFSMAYNNPYIKSVWVEATRASDDWLPGKALIYRTESDRTAYESGTPVADILGAPDSNFVHILHEAMTNADWGMGIPWWALDDNAFRYAAETCYNEKLAGSFLWTKPMPTDRFAQLIADHIRAMIFADPETGLITIRMIRKDYVEADLRVLTPDNSKMTELAIRDANEVVNEVVVNWTNPESEEEESVYAQDLASIADLGEVISEGHDYSFFHRQDLADAAAYRDVLAKTAPVRSATVELPSSANRAKPGQVVRLQYPDDGVPDGIFRVMRVETGKTTARSQIVSLLEDVLSEPVVVGQDRAGTAGSGSTLAVEPPPDAACYSLPYYAIRQAGLDYDDGEDFVGFVVAADQTGTFSAKVFTDKTDSAGDVNYVRTAEVAISRKGTLPSGLSAEAATSALPITLEGYGPTPAKGDFLLIGGDEQTAELALILSYTGGVLSLRRGILDTVPVAWAADVPVWVIPARSRVYERRARSGGEVVSYGFRTVTFHGTLPGSQEVERTVTVALRADRPLRPANVQIDASPFGGANSPLAVGEAFTVTWANRNRILEDSTILSWSEATVTPEPGQTTTVRVVDGSEVEVYAATGLSGTSHVVTMPPGSIGTFTVEVFSMRDGLRSFQTIERVVVI